MEYPNRQSLLQITPPDGLPILLSDAKAHLRVISDDEDDLILGLIRAVTGHLEGEKGILGRCLLTQTWEMTLDRFPDCGTFIVPLPPLVSVTSVKYTDTDGVEQTVSSSVYTVDTRSEKGRVFPAYNQLWPTTRAVPGAVRLRFKAGYGANVQNIPPALTAAMLLLIGHFFENREAVTARAMQVLPYSVTALLSPFKIQAF